MKLSPRDFWSLTPGEWRWLMEAAAPPASAEAMSFEGLCTLMRNYPDEAQGARFGLSGRFPRERGKNARGDDGGFPPPFTGEVSAKRTEGATALEERFRTEGKS